MKIAKEGRSKGDVMAIDHKARNIARRQTLAQKFMAN
jgi:hypothetical protein